MQFMSRPAAGSAGSAGDTQTMRIGRKCKGCCYDAALTLSLHQAASKHSYADHWADMLTPKQAPTVKQLLILSDRVFECEIAEDTTLVYSELCDLGMLSGQFNPGHSCPRDIPYARTTCNICPFSFVTSAASCKSKWVTRGPMKRHDRLKWL